MVAFEKPQGILSQEQATAVGTFQEKTEKPPTHRHRDSKDSLIQCGSASDRNNSGSNISYINSKILVTLLRFSSNYKIVICRQTKQK